MSGVAIAYIATYWRRACISVKKYKIFRVGFRRDLLPPGKFVLAPFRLSPPENFFWLRPWPPGRQLGCKISFASQVANLQQGPMLGYVYRLGAHLGKNIT